MQGASSTDLSSYLHAQITSVSPLVGEASGYADVTGGADAAQFLTGGQTTALGTPADLFVQDNFCANGATSCSAIPSNWYAGKQRSSEDCCRSRAGYTHADRRWTSCPRRVHRLASETRLGWREPLSIRGDGDRNVGQDLPAVVIAVSLACLRFAGSCDVLAPSVGAEG